MTLGQNSLKNYLSPQAYNSLALEKLKRKAHQRTAKQAPDNWEEWLITLFPNVFTAPFAPRHVEYWEWLEAIQPGVKPLPFFAIWPRGGAKTTNAEAGCVRVGAKGVRKFCLYTRGTQDKANESVQSIAALLESKRVEEYYPQLSSRRLGKYGNSKGWRVDTLRCANGFSVVALGYDAAVRGVKLEEYRPDLIIIDDIDDKEDSLETIEKKVRTLTRDILPAGSVDVAVLGIQNLIHPRSIFNQIAEGTAEFLYNRIVSGPYPAIEDLEYEARKAPEKGYRITGGTATWEGQDLATCEKQINEWGLTAFLQESQHEVEDPAGGMYNHIEFRHCDWEEVPDLKRITVWVDPAITDTDQSDAMGIQADGLAADGTIYRLFSWEQRTSPEDAIRRAILKAVELGADTVGFESDQGGDLWKSTYNFVWKKLIEDETLTEDTQQPSFREAKAGAIGSKVHRGNMQVVQYERGRFVHVKGTHRVLEKALGRFPKTKPFDLHDASFWSQYELVGKWSSMGGFIKV
jgi:hypothetical protein